MAVYTYEVATEYNFPNITVYRRFKDGVHNSWRFVSNEGYVMYDTTAEDYKPVEDESGDFVNVPVIYYYTNVDCPLNYNFDNFTWVAVLRSSVPAEDIYGDSELCANLEEENGGIVT